MKINFQEQLNSEQWAAVEGSDGPCLVLAGAGSGKTRTIVYRVAYLLEKGVKPENILLLTFTNHAAREMLERVRGLVGHRADIVGGTFHSVGNRFLRRYGRTIDLAPNFSILDQEDSKDLIGVCLAELGTPKGKKFPGAGVVQAVLSYAKNAQITIAESLETLSPEHLMWDEELSSVAKCYEEKKRASQSLDFDDLLLKSVELLRTVVGDKLSNQFHYILVDEYQDTNALQAEIVKLLARAHGNLMVVGDDAQSIYGFRAADIKNILNFPEIFGKKKTKIFHLATNYRSTPDILDFAHEVISKNKKQYKKKLKSMQAEYVKPQVSALPNTEDEAEFVTQLVLGLRQKGTPLREMAVLFRSSFHSQMLEIALSRAGIPYDYRGGLRFFDRAHIKDIIAFLRLLHNPKEETSWLRLLRLLPGIGQATAGKIFQALRGVKALTEVVGLGAPTELSVRAQAGWQLFGQMLAELVEAQKKDTAIAALIRAVANSAYQQLLEERVDNVADRLEDIEQLAVFAEKEKDLTGFLTSLSLEEDNANRAKEKERERGDKMVLSTIHQAKGLEWEAVFIIHMLDGAFPHKRALFEDGGIEEERRLLYVAATRAKRYLFFSYPKISSWGGEQNYNQPSPFLRELPKHVMEERQTIPLHPWEPACRQGRRLGVDDDEPIIEVEAPPKKRAGFLPELGEL